MTEQKAARGTALDHYFIANEFAPDDERELRFPFKDGKGRGHVLVFKTNSGLFSYKEIDYASRLLMENIPAPLEENAPRERAALLDMGCGYGAIGITLAKAYGFALTMCDINETALKYAAINAQRNAVQAEIIHSDGLASVPGTFDLIVFNPPRYTPGRKLSSECTGKRRSG